MQVVFERGPSPPSARCTAVYPRFPSIVGGHAARWEPVALVLLYSVIGGCALQEVRGKTQFGTEWRHSGNAGTEDNRYTEIQGFELRWDKGITTGVSYRRRDVDDGNGDHDDGVFFEVSYPLWKAPKKEDALAKRVEQLEKELKDIKARSGSGTSGLMPGGKGAEDARVAAATEPAELTNKENQ